MTDVEVHIDLGGRTKRVGLARRNLARGAETVTFEYADDWLRDPGRFSIEPALALSRGAFTRTLTGQIFKQPGHCFRARVDMPLELRGADVG
jgi:serine/threonine-protein kinase HipA